MRRLLHIAGAEWRYWLRSRLASAAGFLVLLLLLVTTVLTTLRLEAERAERTRHQAEAEAAFLSQPDRHPHRMVHYGHYAFRAPTPLAAFDPGLDPVTGQAIFLEGHRQNTAMFAASGASADLGGLSWLSPARVYQLFGPLLLILLGHGLVARERESATLVTLLAQGSSGRLLVAGKGLALASVVGLLLLPLGVTSGLAVWAGEAPQAAWGLMGIYGLYLGLWAGLALLSSTLPWHRSAGLASLVTLWIVLTLVVPALAASAVSGAQPLASQLESDLRMQAELRRLGDGHNAQDPAFAGLRAELLQRHGVQRVEDLPVNLRGVVSQVAEERLTEALNRHAERRRDAETRQADALAHLGWITPLLAVAEASRALAGTDLAHHHRFLREAETLRYDFVQGLNRVHAEQLAYADDIRRGRDAEAERRTRVAASNWALLARFRFEPDPVDRRLARASPALQMLGSWCAVVLLGAFLAGARLRP